MYKRFLSSSDNVQKVFEQQRQCTKVKEEDLSMEDPVSHSSSPNTVHNKMLVNVHHSSDAASTNKSTDFADNQHGLDHCWELLLRYDGAQVGFAPGKEKISRQSYVFVNEAA